MATGQELFDWLKALTPEQRALELSMAGHYGEHNEIQLPEISLVSMYIKNRKKKVEVIKFPMVYVGPEPD